MKTLNSPKTTTWRINVNFVDFGKRMLVLFAAISPLILVLILVYLGYIPVSAIRALDIVIGVTTLASFAFLALGKGKGFAKPKPSFELKIGE